MGNTIQNKSDDDNIADISEEENDEELFEPISDSMTVRQKLILWISGLASLIFFILFLFPVEEVLRTYLYKNTETIGLVLDFKKLKISLFGEQKIDSFLLQTKENLEIRMEEFIADISVYQLIQKSLIGNLSISSFSMETVDYMISMKQINVSDIQINGLDREWINYQGSIQAQMSNGKILKSPNIPFIGDLKDVTINSVILNIRKNGNRLNLEKAIFKTSIAAIKIKGNIDLSSNIKSSRLEIEVCPKLTEKFAIERQDIANTLQLISKDITKEGQETCFPIRGTFSEPKPILPSLGGTNEPGKTSSP